MRGLTGGLYRIMEWIMRLAVINVLWIVFALPFFYFALAGLVSPEITNLSTVLLPLGILAPFTLLPSSAAMFTIARKWTTGEADVPLWKTFFNGYKENYVKSMLGGIIFIVIGGVLYANYHFYLSSKGMIAYLSILFLVFMVFLGAAMINFLSITVHFHMKLMQVVKNSLLITIGQPINSIFLLVANGVILYISLFKFTFLIPFFMGSLMATVSFWNFHRSFVKIQERVKKNEENEKAKEDEERAESSLPELTDGKDD
ncbi:YesL family protein [Gorillibacterium massiliense]|uniref:YesL family protein n=1 Tax=Gorillibacterium massiliense TaxID=1280390 RepID=UPI001EE3334F|nr:DUF624 domain-containing protein [Gorillibacterium massiliense]